METREAERTAAGIFIVLALIIGIFFGNKLGRNKEKKISMREMMIDNRSDMERMGNYYSMMNIIEAQNENLKEENVKLKNTVNVLNNKNGSLNMVDQEVDTIIVKYK